MGGMQSVLGGAVDEDGLDGNRRVRDDDDDDELATAVYKAALVICKEHASQITGMVLECNSTHLEHLLNENPAELSRRIQQADKMVEAETLKHSLGDGASNIPGPHAQSLCGTAIRLPEGCDRKSYTELHGLIRRLIGDDDEAIDFVTFRLLAMGKVKLKDVMQCGDSAFLSTVQRIRDEWSQSSGESNDLMAGNLIAFSQAGTACHSAPDDIRSETANRLNERLARWHPSKAELFTSILMDLDVVTLQHILSSDALLSKKLANVVQDLLSSKVLKSSDVTILKIEIGDIIYNRMPEQLSEECTSKIVGMIIEQDLCQLYGLLGSPDALSCAVHRSLAVLGKNVEQLFA